MSKVKNPRAKKRLSLERDRRNTYGENAKSSRKNIQRGKQRTQMKERRGVTQVLAAVTGASACIAATRTGPSAVSTDAAPTCTVSAVESSPSTSAR